MCGCTFISGAWPWGGSSEEASERKDLVSWAMIPGSGSLTPWALPPSRATADCSMGCLARSRGDSNIKSRGIAPTKRPQRPAAYDSLEGGGHPHWTVQSNTLKPAGLTMRGCMLKEGREAGDHSMERASSEPEEEGGGRYPGLPQRLGSTSTNVQCG